MAEALLAHDGGSRFEVASAGATPAMSVDPVAFEALDQLGIDWRAHRPKGFDAVQATRWDLVITLCDHARETCPVLPGQPTFAHWPVEDPVESSGPPEVRRQVFLEVARWLRRCIARLIAMTPEELRSGERVSGVPIETDDAPGRVLFLCSANAARSQIAEALLAHKARDRFIVASAGSHPAASVRPETIAALREVGIDWSGRRPRGIDEVVRQRWDLVITLCDRMREACPTLPHRPVYAHWGVPDPSSVTDPLRREAAFRDTVGLISWRLELMLAIRPELLDRLVLEERLRTIGLQSPGHSPF